MKTERRFMCDECGKIYPHSFIDDEPLDRMREDDWIRTEDGHDLCPDCAAAAIQVL